MSLYKQKFAQAETLFNARNQRERVLIAFCVVVFFLSVWQFLFYDPTVQAQTKLDSELTSLKTNIDSIDKQYKLLANAKKSDPNQKIKQRISIAKQHLGKLDEQLQLKMKGLIQPTQMANILEEVLTQQTSLQFKRIQSLAAKPLLVNKSEVAAGSEPAKETGLENSAEPTDSNTRALPTGESQQLTNIGVFQHGMEMEFSGSYLETLSYLHKLENLPWNFYWDAVLFDVIDYPKSRVIIRVHTLSLEEGWLGV